MAPPTPTNILAALIAKDLRAEPQPGSAALVRKLNRHAQAMGRRDFSPFSATTLFCSAAVPSPFWLPTRNAIFYVPVSFVDCITLTRGPKVRSPRERLFRERRIVSRRSRGFDIHRRFAYAIESQKPRHSVIANSLVRKLKTVVVALSFGATIDLRLV